MALIVEDGTGKVDSESYISVVDATTYHAARGNAAWAALASDTIREQVLRKATGYMEQAYRERWKMFRVTATQALSWPRAWVQLPDAPYGYGSWAAFVPNNVVPSEVKNACAELALLASVADLNPPLERSTVREKIDVIEVDYDKYAPLYKRYRSVDMMLSVYFKSSGMSSGLKRA